MLLMFAVLGLIEQEIRPARAEPSRLALLHPHRLLTFSSPCCWRMAVRLVLATSSAKALSRKTTWSLPPGPVPCATRRCPAPAAPLLRGRSAGRGRQAGCPHRCCGRSCRRSSSASMGTQRSRPSLSSSSKRMSCSVRSVLRCSTESWSVGQGCRGPAPRPGCCWSRA